MEQLKEIVLNGDEAGMDLYLEDTRSDQVITDILALLEWHKKAPEIEVIIDGQLGSGWCRQLADALS